MAKASTKSASKGAKKEDYSTKDFCSRGKNDCGSTGACSGFAYFLGFIGAAFYYVQATTGFWMGVLGVLKAAIWPAMLVYHLLGL